MKVVKFKNNNAFNAIGVNILKIKDEFKYGIVSDTYRYGEVVCEGTKKKCKEYIANLDEISLR
jgi:hypothetical protein